MKTSVLIILLAIAGSCTSSRNNGIAAPGDTVEQKGDEKNIPACIQKMIVQYQAEEKQNPPRQVVSYLYKGSTVYYITPPCCDFFSDLYDSSCNLIGHPDGGITGKGDGKIVDFLEQRTAEKIIWQDVRK